VRYRQLPDRNRFWNNEVLQNLDGMLLVVVRALGVAV